LHSDPCTRLTADEHKDQAARVKEAGPSGTRKRKEAFPCDEAATSDETTFDPFAEWPWEQSLLAHTADSYIMIKRRLHCALTWSNNHFTDQSTILSREQQEREQRRKRRRRGLIIWTDGWANLKGADSALDSTSRSLAVCPSRSHADANRPVRRPRARRAAKQASDCRQHSGRQRRRRHTRRRRSRSGLFDRAARQDVCLPAQFSVLSKHRRRGPGRFFIGLFFSHHKLFYIVFAAICSWIRFATLTLCSRFAASLPSRALSVT
jgi:hypothetical protein